MGRGCSDSSQGIPTLPRRISGSRDRWCCSQKGENEAPTDHQDRRRSESRAAGGNLLITKYAKRSPEYRSHIQITLGNSVMLERSDTSTHCIIRRRDDRRQGPGQKCHCTEETRAEWLAHEDAASHRKVMTRIDRNTVRAQQTRNMRKRTTRSRGTVLTESTAIQQHNTE